MANEQFESMFETLGQIKVGPTPEEAKKAMENAQRKQKVDFLSYNAKTFVLSNPVELNEYTKLMFVLVEGITKCTHVVFKMDRQFVPTYSTGPTWMVYLEWGEYKLVETIFESVPTANSKAVPEVNEVKDDKQISPTDPLSA